MSELFDFLKNNHEIIKNFQLGIEKEGLRTSVDGQLSQKPHPLSFGSKLTHPFITTDYSESLLEFITGVSDNFKKPVDDLVNLQAFCARHNPEEVIWPMSMPCKLPLNDDDIPVAHYGSSNVGRLKELYRIGLGHRYGRSMQSIAGLHFNFSFDKKIFEKLKEELKPEVDLQKFRDEIYFKVIRNYRRYNWLLAYLFGSSPCVDESFIKGKKHNLQKIHSTTYGSKYATSLRMGGLGYTSHAQESINICYDNLSTYIETLEKARLTSYAPYEQLDKKSPRIRKQLNSNILQIDNEFYSTIRPKHPAHSGQSALGALYQGGIEYLELRIMDLDPFEISGISDETSRFLHLFILTCLAMEDSVMGADECNLIKENLQNVVTKGRMPSLTLNKGNEKVSLKELAEEFFEKMIRIADIVDPDKTQAYHTSILAQNKKINDPEKTPSFRVLELASQEGHIGLGSRLALEHFQAMLEIPVDTDFEAQMLAIAQNSLTEQLEIEKNDTESFDEFIQTYFKQIKIDWV